MRMGPINSELIYRITLLLLGLAPTIAGLSLATFSTSSLSASEEGDRSSLKSIKNATNPVVYTKLRHDHNNLQVFRRYQLLKTHEEKSKQLKLIESFDNNSTKEISYTYYENPAIEAHNITQDDLILEALDRTYKTRLIPVYLHNYDSVNDRADSSDPSLTSASKCERELSYLIRKLDQIEARKGQGDSSIEPELAAFFDSFAGDEPGLLFGNYHWTGNWRQCYKRLVFDLNRSNASDSYAFRGRYCTANIRSSAWDEKIKEKTSELIDNYFKYSQQRYDYARFFRIQVGLCLPESCDSRIIDSRRADIHRLANYKLKEPFKSYDLIDLYCLPDETSKLRRIEPMGWLLILVGSLWVGMILLATYCDYRASMKRNGKKKKSSKSADATAASKPIQKSNSEKLISALSLIKNFHRLTETESITRAATTTAARQQQQQQQLKGQTQVTEQQQEESLAKPRSGPTPNDLLFLNAYKVISMPLIIFGHVGMMAVHLNRFPLDYESYNSDILFHFSSSTVFFVDWYFVITGFLTSYIMFVTKKVERNNLIDWIYSVFHRYWRLAPLYILLVWFNKYLFQHTSYGPVWDYGTSNMTLRSSCRRESWLWPVLLASNLHPIHEECIMPSWYIASDMQFYLITPFILIGLLKWPRITWVATLGAIGASISARIHRYLTDPRVQPLELMRPGFDLFMRNNWDVHATYIYPQYRIPSHLIGILAGHYAYKVLKGDWSSPLYRPSQLLAKRSTNQKGENRGSLLGRLTWLMGIQIVFYMAFATWPIKDLFPRSLEPQVKYFTAIVYGFDHSTAALGMALMFVSLIFGHFASIRKFLTLPFWSVISRFNYIVFLVQVELIQWVFQSSERIPDFSNRESFKLWIMMVALCYSTSAMLTLLIELPLAHLEREYLGSYMAVRAKAQQGQKQAKTYQQLHGQRIQQCEMVIRSESSQLVGETDHNQPKRSK